MNDAVTEAVSLIVGLLMYFGGPVIWPAQAQRVNSGSNLNAPGQPSGLLLRYHNTRHGFTLFLPVSWKGYSVFIQEWSSSPSLDAADKTAVTDHGPMIVFRHPKWKPSAPYQDIPVLVFTRGQWDALHQGKIWPSLYAGGMMSELWHNEQTVFAISSRYNADDSLNGWKQAADIIAQNRAANNMPRLYPE